MIGTDRVTALLLSALVISLGTTAFQVNRIHLGHSELRKAQDLSQSRFRHANAGLDELRYLKTHYSEFEQSVSDSGTDPRNKLRWLQVMQSAKSELGIAELGVEIYPQKTLQIDRQGMRVSVGVETLAVEMALLHDGKLAEFFTYLTAHAPTGFVVNSFEINRSQRAIDNGVTRAKTVSLNFTCTLSRYTVSVLEEPGSEV